MSLSIVISAYNEEKKIEDCLKSAIFADEIIFVDNTSSDKTVEIAKKYTSNIFVRQNNLMLNVNKNFGFSKAKGDWILSLDSDERVSDELQKEIKTAVSNKQSAISGFWIPRKNIIFGKWMEHSGWYPDYQLRLFKNGKGRFAEKHVHEMIEIEGETKRLTNPMIHYNYDNVSQFLHKLSVIYGPNEAENLIKKGIKVTAKDAIVFPTQEFLKRFFAQDGYKDGLHGLTLSLFMAFYHFVVFAMIWEKQKFQDEEGNILGETEKQIKKSYKEIMFWFLDKKSQETKNLFSKLFLKIKKRIN